MKPALHLAAVALLAALTAGAGAMMTACSSTASNQATAERDSANRVIYEVFVRNFSPEGNLKGVEKQIPRLRDLGIDVLSLMPIYTPGETDRRGTYASPYCVKDYKGIDPDYGTADDLRSLVKTAHDNGIEVWLDWVANHTSTDNAWVKSHPDFYVREGNEPRHPFGVAWKDVYQLDYSNKQMQDSMISAMQYWVREFDIDGYRCDYADSVPQEFWQRAHDEVNTIKPLTWMAESGGNNEHRDLINIFDYNYARDYSDSLRHLGEKVDVERLARINNDFINGPDSAAYVGKSRMVYISNHDVVQDKGGSEEKVFGANLKPMTVMMFTVWGMPLIYNGREIQYKSGATPPAEKFTIDRSSADTTMTALIKHLIDIKHTSPALRTDARGGQFINLTTEGPDNDSPAPADVYIFERRAPEGSVVVALNFGDETVDFRISEKADKKIENGLEYVEHFSGLKSVLLPSPILRLEPHGYMVWVSQNNQ